MEHLTRPAAFLDRDGTLNERPPPHRYVQRIEQFRLLPGAIEGMVRLARCGYVLVVVSNQRGMARGLVSRRVLDETEQALQAALSVHGVAISGFYYCPHDLGDPSCDCRKPQPGLLIRAAKDLDLELGVSWTIGDSATDIEAGMAAGTRLAYVGPGDAPGGCLLSADTLGEAAEMICARR